MFRILAYILKGRFHGRILSIPCFAQAMMRLLRWFPLTDQGFSPMLPGACQNVFSLQRHFVQVRNVDARHTGRYGAPSYEIILSRRGIFGGHGLRRMLCADFSGGWLFFPEAGETDTVTEEGRG